MSAKLKDVVRSIRNTMSRYLSIFMIVAIGVGFFGGVKATGPDMRLSTDLYSDSQNLMHFRLLSTWGFDEKDLQRLELVTGAQVRASCFLDVVTLQNGTSRVARLYAYERLAEVNQLTLAEGKWPRTERECLAEIGSGLKVGDQITLDTESMKEQELTVSGLVETALYLSDFEKGNTNVGSGSISQILFVPASDFLSEVYTEAYLVYEDMKEAESYSEKYNSLERDHKEDLEVIGEDLAEQRKKRVLQESYEQLEEAQQQIDEANEQIGDGLRTLMTARTQYKEGKLEYDEGSQTLSDNEQLIQNGESELNSKENELALAQSQLAGAKAQYNQGVREYETAKAEAETQLSDAWAKLEAARVQLESGKTQLDTAKSRLDGAYEVYNSVVAQHTKNVTDANTFLDSLLENENASPEAVERARTALTAVQQYADTQIAEAKSVLDGYQAEYQEKETLYNTNKAAYDSALSEYETQKTEAESRLAKGKAELDSAYAQITASESQIKNGQSQLASARNELEAGKLEIAQGIDQLELSKLTLEDAQSQILQKTNELKANIREIISAQKELDEKKAELENLEAPTWYIFTRSDNPGYEEFGQNAERMNNISKVFPVFFILVAALVVLTTMTRMLEEERTQIGTMKALGYSDFSILSKYILYTLSASGLGSFVGAALGYFFFPWVIMTVYSIMYHIPAKTMPFYWEEALLITFIAMFICAITVILCFLRSMHSTPAQMMRPKAPKKGKKVLLESIPWLWRHLSFSKKVMIRNLFRYKKRMIMTIVGIMGCTALSLTGFGLSDAINDIIDNQFEIVWKYDGMVLLDKAVPREEERIRQILQEYDDSAVCMLSLQKSFTFEHDENHMSGYLSVGENPDTMQQLLAFTNRETGEQYSLQEGVVLVTEKMADKLQVSEGDELQIRMDDIHTIPVTVGGIVENYAYHYVYMDPVTYTKLFGEKTSYNTLLVKADMTEDEENAAAEEILKLEHVVTYQKMSSARESYTRMIQALNLVVLVLIGSAALLAFVVVYNLTNINITERIREIATLEVLGFRDHEVSQYIFNEGIIMTLLGAGAGLIVGQYLCQFVVATAEVDMVMFGREIHSLSYLWAALLTVLFSEVVNLIMRGPLRKISMVESLKSVE